MYFKSVLNVHPSNFLCICRSSNNVVLDLHNTHLCLNKIHSFIDSSEKMCNVEISWNAYFKSIVIIWSESISLIYWYKIFIYSVTKVVRKQMLLSTNKVWPSYFNLEACLNSRICFIKVVCFSGFLFLKTCALHCLHWWSMLYPFLAVLTNMVSFINFGNCVHIRMLV